SRVSQFCCTCVSRKMTEQAPQNTGLVLNLRDESFQNYGKRKSSGDIGQNHSENSSSKRQCLDSSDISSTEKESAKDKLISKDAASERKDQLTSLFTGNPNIPFIQHSDVKPVSEKVFSEDSFGSLNIAPQIVSNVEKMGFTSLTMVQKNSIPGILAGRDALIKSQTGSGKTLTYALPLIHNLMMLNPKVKRSDGTLALVIVPTRELALQSYQWFEKLCKSCVWVVPGYLIGGEKKKAEKARLRKGVNILVATPGRLIDHLHHTKCLSLTKLKYLIIDEADRLLEAGYEQSVTSIMQSLSEATQGRKEKRQTVMLSATLTAGVEKLAGMSMENPDIVDISNENENYKDSDILKGEQLTTPKNLTQHYLLVPAKLRMVTLAAFILAKCRYGDERKMLIFMSTQDMVDYHTAVFSRILARYGQEKKIKKSSLARRAEKVLAGEEDDGESGVESQSDDDDDDDDEDDENNDSNILFSKLHGNMTQQDRTSVFNAFREASSGVLLCTDVASRGLDLPRVNWIVQFNAACTAEDYVHRVGRTARVNKIGSALVMLAPGEASYVEMLEKHSIKLKEIKMQRILQNLMLVADGTRNKDGPQTMEEAATRLQLKFENMLLADSHLHQNAKKAYVSFVRSYASYPKEVRELFNFKALHLGHYAKSMGLRDSPQALGASVAFRKKKEFKERKERKEKIKSVKIMKQRSYQLPKSAALSEFSSGLDGLGKLLNVSKSSNKGTQLAPDRYQAKKEFKAYKKSKAFVRQ
ncbi:unnamed protein product, partial [Meganyctiphanes norvegica]